MTGNVIFNDNVKALFGTGSDASILYDGTNLAIDPKEVGTGAVLIKNGANVEWEDSNNVVAGRMTVSTSNTDFIADNGNQFRILTDNGSTTGVNRMQMSAGADATTCTIGNTVSTTSLRLASETLNDSELSFYENGIQQCRIFYDTSDNTLRVDEVTASTCDAFQLQDMDFVIPLNAKLHMDSFFAGNTYIQSPTSPIDAFHFTMGGIIGFRLEETNFEVDVVCGQPAVTPTDNASGFLYIPTVATTPTGTPTGFTGKVALVYSTGTNELFVYDAGWLKVAVA